MPRYALKMEYHGAPFCGWQRQKDLPSVQARLEEAVRQLEPGLPRVTGAGRTDAGVHATGQVAHFDAKKGWDAFRLCEALNHHLRPDPVAIVDAAEVAENFNARFSALGRRYVYRLVQRRAPMTHEKGLVWRVLRPLDVPAMREAAEYLLGKHDFTTFRSSLCQAASPVKTLDSVDIFEHQLAYGMEIRFEFKARSFLHNQVRSFVGTLERVGAGAWEPIRVRTALDARNRAHCGPVAPPQGLYLAAVRYEPDPFAQKGME